MLDAFIASRFAPFFAAAAAQVNQSHAISSQPAHAFGSLCSIRARKIHDNDKNDNRNKAFSSSSPMLVAE